MMNFKQYSDTWGTKWADPIAAEDRIFTFTNGNAHVGRLLIAVADDIRRRRDGDRKANKATRGE